MTFEKKHLGHSFLFTLFCLTFFLLAGAGKPFFCSCQDLPSTYSAYNDGFKSFCLVIDPGHGGKDNGATFEPDLPEKDMTLNIAEKLNELITSDTGMKAVLTRSGDYDVPLENRAAIANHQKADLFLSIHFSNHLYPASEELRIFTAAYSPEEVEYSSTKSESWQSMQSKHLTESRKFAQQIEKAAQMSGFFKSVSSLEAPVYVLAGASMPAVAVEVGIASTQKGIEKIKTDEYRWQIARALFTGILNYMKEQEQTP